MCGSLAYTGIERVKGTRDAEARSVVEEVAALASGLNVRASEGMMYWKR